MRLIGETLPHGELAFFKEEIQHRLSKDLDFFTDTEQQVPPIEFPITLIRRLPSVRDIRYEHLFDRRIFEVLFKDSD
jgi:hypothetical protein